MQRAVKALLRQAFHVGDHFVGLRSAAANCKIALAAAVLLILHHKHRLSLVITRFLGDRLNPRQRIHQHHKFLGLLWSERVLPRGVVIHGAHAAAILNFTRRRDPEKFVALLAGKFHGDLKSPPRHGRCVRCPNGRRATLQQHNSRTQNGRAHEAVTQCAPTQFHMQHIHHRRHRRHSECRPQTAHELKLSQHDCDHII